MDTLEFENRIIPVFPRTDENAYGDIDFEMIDCDPVGDIAVVDDVEIARSVIEVNGEESRLDFHTRTTLPYLALQIKNLNRFLKVVLKIHDTNDKVRTITFSNKRTTIHIQGSHCAIPMELGMGWQYVNLDLEDIMTRCFGTSVVYDKEYSDAELPKLLRILRPEA